MQSKFFDSLGAFTIEEYLDSFKPDVVIFHSHYYPEYALIYKSLVKRGIPYYIQPHGSFGLSALNKSKIKKLLANHLFFHSYMKHAYGYIFLNETEKMDAQFKGKHDLVIPNGIKVNEIKKESFLQEQWFFYFIGRFDVHHKGLDYLFEAFDILEQQKTIITVKFFGTGTTEEVEYVDSRSGKYKYVRVINCGPKYGEEQAKTLEQCGIMLLTSRYEGFPMTVLEAWKYGNPCLVTPGTNVSNEIEDNQLGWCTSCDPYQIANTIINASKEYTSDRVDYVKRCKSYVGKKYDWNRIALESYQKMYREIIE